MVKTGLMLLFLLWVPSTWAYFTVPGQGQLMLLDGTKQSLQFGFSFLHKKMALKYFRLGFRKLKSLNYLTNIL